MPPTRAKQACQFCNGRRIKCNVMESMPCRNCIAANTKCHVRTSARGKWPRKPKVQPSLDDTSTRTAVTPQSECTSSSQGLTDGPREDTLDSLAIPCQDNEVYLGESTLLGAVHNDRSDSKSHRSKSGLRYPLPVMAAIPEWEHRRKQRRLELLAAEGAMSLPDQSVQEVLLQAYFKWFHRCFPIINKPAITDTSLSAVISPMLCQAMLFIGVIHCNGDQLREIGLGSGDEARHLFYSRAKDLHDADFDTDSLTQVQTMFLLSFWRAGPLLQKDSRFWLGSAITLAQKKGLHRSFGCPDLGETRLRKRIWWSIYIRERQCAAALGLPNRIHDEDCDISPLTSQDFEDPDIPNSPRVALGCLEMSYVTEMATLAQFLGKIVSREYAPHSDRSPSDRADIRSDLYAWHRQLPDHLSLNNKAGNLFVGMLHMAYNNLLILGARRAFIAEINKASDGKGQVAYQAACQISRIAEDLLAENLLGHGQIHLITCLFNALCIHTLNLRQAEGTSRLVAEHRAKICLYGLRELQQTWEVTNWILQLFFQHLDRSIARFLEAKRQDEEPQPAFTTSKGDNSWFGAVDNAPVYRVDDLVDPTELGTDRQTLWPLNQDNRYFTAPGGEGVTWDTALSNLDGITLHDLELLAGCLT